MPISPRMLMADVNGNIIDNPALLMLASRKGKNFVPAPADLIPLPSESELFLLPGRKAAGFNPKSGRQEYCNNFAVAAFAAPAYTLDAHPAYIEESGAPILPLFAYAAVGYAKGRFWICARKVDNNPRQIFTGIPPERIKEGCDKLLAGYPQNRLLKHIIQNCVRVYSCPAARNFALGRYEAPLPSSQSCNAHCLACISKPQKDGANPVTPQCRLNFIPSSSEIAEIMLIHEGRERKEPIYSFGQGCEGDPLMNAPLLAESIRLFRKEKLHGRGNGTINCNTNASVPEAVSLLAESGLTSLRVSLNSSQPEFYEAYYRPSGYDFSNVVKAIRLGRKAGLYISLNLLFFPGLTDTREELEALIKLCTKNGVSMIQWRNLNIDPNWYLEDAEIKRLSSALSHPMGLKSFMRELKKACPWLDYGYFNPWLGSKAQLKAPEIS